MTQRLRELGCVLFGHAWDYFDGTGASAIEHATHKFCRRCYRNELNL